MNIVKYLEKAPFYDRRRGEVCTTLLGVLNGPNGPVRKKPGILYREKFRRDMMKEHRNYKKKYENRTLTGFLC